MLQKSDKQLRRSEKTVEQYRTFKSAHPCNSAQHDESAGFVWGSTRKRTGRERHRAVNVRMEPEFACPHCLEPFPSATGRIIHVRTCGLKHYLPVPQPDADGSPSQGQKLHLASAATASRSRPDAPASPRSNAERTVAGSPASQHGQPSSSAPSACEPSLGAVPAPEVAEQPDPAAGDRGAPTHAVTLPFGRPFKLPDVQGCPCSTADDDSEPEPAALPSGLTPLALRLLRFLHRQPRAQQRELLDMIHVGGLCSETAQQIQTPADVPRLLEELAAFGGYGGVISGSPFVTCWHDSVLFRQPHDCAGWRLVLRGRS